MNLPQSLSLYLHIPFCRHRCAYCDFNTFTSLDALKPAYASALSREVRQVAGDSKRSAHTIFFGGGTPSLLAPRYLKLILRALREGFELSGSPEVTLEANPDTVDAEYLATIHALGINRLSIGAQSADPSELSLLEREHSFDAVVRAVELSRAAGFDNLNLDLIYGLPGQDLNTWESTLRTALDLAPDHLSLYCLIVEPGTPMHRWLNNGRLVPPDADMAADQFEFAVSLLARRGFVHYEISNWALPGRECQHNLTYWRNNEFLGFGAGAHGHAAGFRYAVVKQPRVYIRRLNNNVHATYPWSAAVAERHRISRREAMSDTIITQLRLLQEGLSLASFAAEFDRSLYDAFPGTTEQMIEWNLLHEAEGRLLLTSRGQFLSNQVFYRYV